MVLAAPGGPEITVAIRQGPMILNCCVWALVRAVAIGYVQTLSVLATTPDQIRQPAECDATEVGHHVEHITAAVRQKEALDQLAGRCMHGEYAECPPGANAQHQRRKSRCGKDSHVDHLVEPGDPRPCQPLGGIHGDQLYGHGNAESPA